MSTEKSPFEYALGETFSRTAPPLITLTLLEGRNTISLNMVDAQFLVQRLLRKVAELSAPPPTVVPADVAAKKAAEASVPAPNVAAGEAKH